MKRLAVVLMTRPMTRPMTGLLMIGLMTIGLMTGMLAAWSLPCAAEAPCTQLVVQARVEAAPGTLTLADLLTRDSCAQLLQAATHVSLGTAPRSGRVRILAGGELRQWLETLVQASAGRPETISLKIPERVLVQSAGAMKSCREIARFLAGAAPTALPASKPDGQWQQDLNCAATRGLPQSASLELTNTAWNAAAERWEFALRCTRSEDCIPFLVWAHADRTPPPPRSHAPQASGDAVERLVKSGQTATLTWDEAGIRVVAPVTCLDAGGLGQFVRVRFKNGPRMLRAEVVGNGTLRANL